MEKDKERLKVIENIKKNIREGRLNDKVELNDPIVTEEQRQNVVLQFDIMHEKKSSKIKSKLALSIANNYTKLFNKKTEIIGLDKLEGLDLGAIITSNHFSVQDSTIIRHLTNKLKKTDVFHIVIEESNLFMEGEFGLLLNYCNTIPLSESRHYMSKKFYPAVEEFLSKKHWILIYPEEEMWFNYRKPRPGKIGAYHIACKYNVPIISCFVEMIEEEDFESNGFKKLRYKLHILDVLYPDCTKLFKNRKEDLKKRDNELKRNAYEKIYGKKLEYKFENTDIAGF